MESTHSTDPTEPSRADKTVRQRIEAARQDPTQPLYLGTTTETDEPMTLSRTERFSPMLITGNIGTGKTILCRHLATQQLQPDSGLCYVQGHGFRPVFEPPQATDRTRTSIDPGPFRDASQATDAIPDEIGTEPTIHSLGLETRTGTDANTHLLTPLIENVLINKHRQRGTDPTPYTLVFDGVDSLIEMDRLQFRQLLAETRKLQLHIIIAVQSLTHLPRMVQQQLVGQFQTYLTGTVGPPDAAHLAHYYPTVTPDDLKTLPRYQWWLCEHTGEGPQETQFTSAPPLPRATSNEEAQR